MKTLKTTIAITSMILALSFVQQPKVEAQTTWGAWESTGVGISIRFSRVNNTTLTWAFRNDTNQPLTSMDFNFSYVDADSGQYSTAHDLLPYTLNPGASVGGWTCYSANTRGSVSIAIQHYKFGR
jgi:hypothetical protein